MIAKTAQLRTDPAVILDVVAALLESNGYDGWQLDDVAENARVSLATIYKHFPSRGELIVAALERWMEIHAYGPLRAVPRRTTFRCAHPDVANNLRTMGEAPGDVGRIHARPLGRRGRTLACARQRFRGSDERCLRRADPSDAADLGDILANVTFGALSRYVSRGDRRVRHRASDRADAVLAEQPSERMTRQSGRTRPRFRLVEGECSCALNDRISLLLRGDHETFRQYRHHIASYPRGTSPRSAAQTIARPSLPSPARTDAVFPHEENSMSQFPQPQIYWQEPIADDADDLRAPLFWASSTG